MGEPEDAERVETVQPEPEPVVVIVVVEEEPVFEQPEQEEVSPYHLMNRPRWWLM